MLHLARSRNFSAIPFIKGERNYYNITSCQMFTNFSFHSLAGLQHPSRTSKLSVMVALSRVVTQSYCLGFNHMSAIMVSYLNIKITLVTFTLGRKWSWHIGVKGLIPGSHLTIESQIGVWANVEKLLFWEPKSRDKLVGRPISQKPWPLLKIDSSPGNVSFI